MLLAGEEIDMEQMTGQVEPGTVSSPVEGILKPRALSIFPNKNPPETTDGESEISRQQIPVDVFDDRGGYCGGMRVGRDYQAKIPPFIPVEERNIHAENDKALLVWCPNNEIPDEKFKEYIDAAREKFQYSGEQALGLLYWHKYDMEQALHDLGNFAPHPEEWTVEDKVLFEQAFQFHGKAFDKIRQMLPDKSMSSLIRFYYKWKKFKARNSVMDRQVKKFNQEDEQEGATQSANYSNGNASEDGNGTDNNKSSCSTSTDNFCANCGVHCNELYSKDNMCKTCHTYWKRTGDYRPLTGPLRRVDRQVLGLLRHRRLPPVGMYLNHDDLSLLAGAPPSAENVAIQGLEKEIIDMKCRVQETKQEIEILKKNIPSNGIAHLKPKEIICSPSGRINSRWSQDELMFASQGIRRYGKNFHKIAELIGTKTETHVKNFFVHYRRRYDLDKLLKEYELDNEGEDTQ